MRVLVRLLAVLVLGCLTTSICNAESDGRLVVLISDLHLGLGRTPDGRWNPYEDFRWPKALRAFLTTASEEGNGRVDLVILGDLLELWQRPNDSICAGTGADVGCSVEESAALTNLVVHAHEDELTELSEFSKKGANRVFVVPGNHDAALLVPPVWEPLSKLLDARSGRVILVRSGIWQSDDGKILAEHGHQIGSDVNAFTSWPVVTTLGADGKDVMIRPWGERFVQKLFNAEEQAYPIIDNLSPESAGARYRLADRGVTASVEDIAKFIAFNIFETSFEQKRSALGNPAPGQPEIFDRAVAENVGYKLFSYSLPSNDPIRRVLDGESSEAVALSNELNSVAKRLSDEDLRMLCRNAVAYTASHPCDPTLSAAAVSLLVPKEQILKKHLASRQKAYGQFRIFVYGHTHQWEDEWKVASGDAGQEVRIFNTGAFQRLIDEDAFLKLASDRGLTPAQALRRLQPEDLPPCYSSVFIKDTSEGLEAELRLWKMEENEVGRFRKPGVSDCPGSGQ